MDAPVVVPVGIVVNPGHVSALISVIPFAATKSKNTDRWLEVPTTVVSAIAAGSALFRMSSGLTYTGNVMFSVSVPAAVAGALRTSFEMGLLASART